MSLLTFIIALRICSTFCPILAPSKTMLLSANSSRFNMLCLRRTIASKLSKKYDCPINTISFKFLHLQAANTKQSGL